MIKSEKVEILERNNASAIKAGQLTPICGGCTNKKLGCNRWQDQPAGLCDNYNPQMTAQKFRVRQTDNLDDKWTVADGTDVKSTGDYIDGSGEITSYCAFQNKEWAEEALTLYESKQTTPKNNTAGETKYGHPRFYEMLEAMADLHSQKNHDYAGTSDPLKNLRACERLELKPFIGVIVRLQDKWSRLEEFVKSGKLMVKGESVIDTLLDNAVYSVLAIILYEEQQKNEND